MNIIEAVKSAMQQAEATEKRWEMPAYSKATIDAFQQNFPGKAIGDEEGDSERRIARAATLAALNHLKDNVTPEMLSAAYDVLSVGTIDTAHVDDRSYFSEGENKGWHYGIMEGATGVVQGRETGSVRLFRAMLDQAIKEIW